MKENMVPARKNTLRKKAVNSKPASLIKQLRLSKADVINT